ncbi:MAG: helix-turn-helix transcriptional regulator [Pirellulales bacterium]
MSIADFPSQSTHFFPLGTSLPEKKPPQPRLHRIREVREQQGMSLRSAARHMNMELRVLRSQEEESADLSLSDLYRWQKVLDVPVADLLEEQDSPISRPVLERARLVKIMKTAAAILEKAADVGTRRQATMLVEQLIELMPELENVTAWHAVGHRRSLEEYGRIAERVYPDDSFGDD